jgi:hypothetical protein
MRQTVSERQPVKGQGGFCIKAIRVWWPRSLPWYSWGQQSSSETVPLEGRSIRSSEGNP